MAELTTGRRSALLARLMREMERKQAFTGNKTGGEAVFRGLAMKLQQNKIEELQEQEKASAKTRGASEAALLSSLTGEKQSFGPRAENPGSGGLLEQFQGPESQQTADPQAQLSQLLTNHPDSQLGQMAAQMQLQQSFQKTERKKHASVQEFQEITGYTDGQLGTPKAKEDYLQFQRDKKVASQTTVNLGPGQTGTIRDLEAADFKNLETRMGGANSALLTHEVSGDMLRLLDEGVFTGATSPLYQGVARVLSAVGAGQMDSEGMRTALEKLANTEEFESKGGVLVGQIIRLFGSGTGLSDADREYAAAIAGAVSNRNEKSLRSILSGGQQRAERDVKLYNGLVDAYSRPDNQGTSIDLTGAFDKVELPKPGARSAPKTGALDSVDLSDLDMSTEAGQKEAAERYYDAVSKK